MGKKYVSREMLIRELSSLEREVSEKYSKVSKLRLSNIRSVDKLDMIRELYTEIDHLELKINRIKHKL